MLLDQMACNVLPEHISHLQDKRVAKNHTKTIDNLVIYRLNIIETDFRLGKTTLFEHFEKLMKALYMTDFQTILLSENVRMVLTG
jgi:hypothetical protein